nr:MAG TPA: hypothetical protein [Caudoviricetes sp.]
MTVYPRIAITPSLILFRTVCLCCLQTGNDFKVFIDIFLHFPYYIVTGCCCIRVYMKGVIFNESKYAHSYIGDS